MKKIVIFNAHESRNIPIACHYLIRQIPITIHTEVMTPEIEKLCNNPLVQLRMGIKDQLCLMPSEVFE